MSSNVLNLSNLPLDVIRIIVDEAPLLFIDELRLISHQWSALVPTRIDNRRVIESLIWDMEHEVETISICYSESRSGKTRTFRERHLINGRKERNRISRLFRRCRRVERLEVNPRVCEDAIYAVVRSEKIHLPVDNLVINLKNILALDKTTKKSILKLLRHCSVNRLSVTAQFELSYQDASVFLFRNTLSLVRQAEFVADNIAFWTVRMGMLTHYPEVDRKARVEPMGGLCRVVMYTRA